MKVIAYFFDRLTEYQILKHKCKMDFTRWLYELKVHLQKIKNDSLYNDKR